MVRIKLRGLSIFRLNKKCKPIPSLDETTYRENDYPRGPRIGQIFPTLTTAQITNTGKAHDLPKCLLATLDSAGRWANCLSIVAAVFHKLKRSVWKIF